MRLNRPVVCLFFIVLISFSCVLTAEAKGKNFTLQGEINIGDKKNDHINPLYMLRADGSNNSGLINPTPVNPIHFNLSNDIRLDQLELLDLKKTNRSLFFVIWNSSGEVVVNLRSKDSKKNIHKADLKPNLNLPKGDYRIAVVGQCYYGSSDWSNSCSDYDNFNFTDIKFKVGEGVNNSFAFIQRRHIGDSDDSNNGYTGDKWYPDDDEGSYIQYTFKANLDADGAQVNIYNYRNLLANQDHVNLILADKESWTVISSTFMNTNRTSGDFVWSTNVNLQKDKEYLFQIWTTSRGGDLDDISWDDVVIKLGNEDDVDHYRITHPASALTCDTASITINACSNPASEGSCSIVDIDESIQLSVNGTGQNVNLVSGAAVINNLNRASPGNLTLALDSNTYCNSSTTNASCMIDFKDIGLQFSSAQSSNQNITNQVAGINIDDLYLRALEDDGTGTCVALDIPTPSFELGVDCIAPGSCGAALPFKVGAQELGKDGATTSVSLSRVATGVFQVNNANYGDAGQIRLNARHTFANGVEASGVSNDFAVRPHHFNIQAVHSTGISDTDLQERSAGVLTNTQIAASPFTFTVSAVNAANNITKNYVESGNLKMKLTRSSPSGSGFEGIFTYASSESLTTSTSGWVPVTLSTFVNDGVSEYINAEYSEVGAIKVNISDSNYYGMQIFAFEESNAGVEIGRFIPQKFVMTNSSVSNFVNSASDRFTYMDQPILGFEYRIEARNARGGITKNYDGDLVYSPTQKQAYVSFYAESDTIDLQSRLMDFSGFWCAGFYQSGDCNTVSVDTGKFTRAANDAPDGPMINVYYGLNIIDRDGVSLDGKDISFGGALMAKRFSNDKSELRYGRINVLDGYGPVGPKYAVGANLEYFNGTSFIKNVDDSVTQYSLGLMSVAAPDASLTLENGDVNFQDGYSQSIKLESPADSRDVKVEYDADDWLENGNNDPEATISFGFFRGNDRVIYRRRLN